ncbi:MAG: hypothetical protein WAN51_01680 [Alphaproteobacteria bacterium]
MSDPNDPDEKRRRDELVQAAIRNQGRQQRQEKIRKDNLRRHGTISPVVDGIDFDVFTGE